VGVQKRPHRSAPWIPAAVLFALITGAAGAADDLTQKQLEELRQQNQQLQQQLNRQQTLLEELQQKISKQDKAKPEPAGPETAEPSMPRKAGGLTFGKLNLGMEGGLAFFRSESAGPAPHADFRVDEARLFVEANVWKDVYVFSEINLTTREDQEFFLQAGELYVDFEDISRLWNRERQLNVRVGRMDIPFGEEYLSRDAIDNPLISHSLSDIWGVDEGVELYGSVASVQYALAVQNGGHPALHDYDADKSIALRIGYDPTKWLHLSGSAMRTGALAVQGDVTSELWFGNAFVRSLGSGTKFQANLLEGDVRVRLPRGHVAGAGGYLKYDDNDSNANNQREVYYYYVEGLQHLTPKLYGAVRWSQILAPKGFPLLGHGDYFNYFLSDLTKDLWRLSIGVGYRWSPNLLLKGEYTFNQGKTTDGEKRTHENLASAELAFRF
jgi:hypothetical protein